MGRLVLGLNAATVLLVVAGILLLAIPSRVPVVNAASFVVSASATPDSVRLPPSDFGAVERVVRTDIFSPRRSAPPRRYMFGDAAQETSAAAETAVTTPLAGEAMDSTAASTSNDPVPHLYGTMLGAESTALLRLDGSVSEPRLYRVGDRAGGYRVAEIADRSVTLIGPGGRIVLKLRSSP